MALSMRVKKGDTVQVTAGKFKGKQGKIMEAMPDRQKVVVEGVNLVKRHRKPLNSSDPGGIVDVIKPVDVSNVQLVCPSCGKLTRVAYEMKDNKKVRVCKKCHATV
jgi:large subunit ribosomal protein L24